jgi:hypothetical protein
VSSIRTLNAAMLNAVVLLTSTIAIGQTPNLLTDGRRLTLQDEADTLELSLRRLRLPPSDGANAAIFQKGLAWALRYDREFSPANLKLLNQATLSPLARGNLAHGF